MNEARLHMAAHMFSIHLAAANFRSWPNSPLVTGGVWPNSHSGCSPTFNVSDGGPIVDPIRYSHALRRCSRNPRICIMANIRMATAIASTRTAPVIVNER